MKEKAQDWLDTAKEGNVRRRDVWFLQDVQFWPREGYGSFCYTETHANLEKVLQKQYYQLLPLGGVVTGCDILIPSYHGATQQR